MYTIVPQLVPFMYSPQFPVRAMLIYCITKTYFAGMTGTYKYNCYSVYVGIPVFVACIFQIESFLSKEVMYNFNYMST